MEKIKKKPEILAPAGSIESLKGAINAGADAVYIGGSKFGARAYADNPEMDILLEAIDYVHRKDRRIYLTVNTLLKEKELREELYEFIEKYYRAGVDAVIVQDVGVLHFLAKHFPELPIHASTQMTLVSADGVKVLSDYPVTRIVPARELSLEEIKNIRNNTTLEIEAFVHGALCYCYSGQCLFSSMIGGRSGNRGRCAQPCRMAYSVLEDGKKKAVDLYVLSPKDMCTLDRIPELIKAGIDSFKIEGRMKRPEYAAGVTVAYRLMTDLYTEYGEKEFYEYLKKHPNLLQEQLDMVADLYNRGGFTKGYYMQYHGKTMMSMNRPNHTGVKVGEVAKVQGNRAGVRLERKLNAGDILEIRTTSGESYEFTVGKARIGEPSDWYETNVKKGFPLKKGQEVYRTKNEVLLHQLRETYVEGQIQLPVQAECIAIPNQPAVLTVSLKAHQKSSLLPKKDMENVRNIVVTVTGEEVLEAKNAPMTASKIKEQLSKTGESDFFFQQLQVTVGEKTFLPVGKIKELRRTALEQLKGQLLQGYRRELPEKTIQEDNEKIFKGQTEIIALVSEKNQWQVVLEDDRISTVYLDLQNLSLKEQIQCCKETKERGKKTFLVLPHIFREKEKVRYQAELEDFYEGEWDGFLVKSLEELTFLKEYGLDNIFELRLNYNLYVFQTEAKEFFRKKNVKHFTAPLELNEEELSILGVEDCDFIVYGRMPLMVSAQCIRNNVLSCSNGGKTEGIVLSDRIGVEFPVRQICSSCYNVIYNSVCFSLLGMGVKEIPAGFRLDFTIESEEEVKKVISAFFSEDTKVLNAGPYTKGHFKRGVE